MASHSNVRGKERERNLSRSEYFSESYFAISQLLSLATQVSDVHSMGRKKILEIGIGNGFTSRFLRDAGFDVKTADINPDLHPDFCCSLEDLPKVLTTGGFELVVCCEVLEHLPFEGFEKTLEMFRLIAPDLYLTLPNCSRTFGFGGLINLPLLAPQLFSFQIPTFSKRKIMEGHYWELGSSSETSVHKVREALSRFYKSVSVTRFKLNSYHYAFRCRS